jgi:hypothetical protein
MEVILDSFERQDVETVETYRIQAFKFRPMDL